MDFAGAQQTCFSDWGRIVLEYFPTAKFSIHNGKVSIFVDNADVGYYDFNTGTGVLADGFPKLDPNSVGRFESFAPIDIDMFIN